MTGRLRWRALVRGAGARFLLVYMMLLAGATAAVFAFIYWSATTVIERQVADTVAAELRGLADLYLEEGLPGVAVAIERRSGPQGDSDGVYLLARGTVPVAGNLRDWPPSVRVDGSWQRMTLYRADRDGPRQVGLRAFDLDGGLRLIVGRDLRARAEFRDTLWGALAWALAIMAAFGLLSGILMSRYAFARVEAIAGRTDQIIRGDLSGRVPESARDDEFDQLARGLNRTLDRVDALMTGLRTVTDSVAHDLRRPLTRLKARVELALEDRDIGPAGRAALEDVREQADQLLRVLTALLDIAQAEAGIGRETMTSTDLAAIAADVVDLYRPVAEEKGIELDLDAGQAVLVDGHPQLIAQALSNLVDNAIKFTPSGGRIVVAAQRRDEGARLIVVDNGPGIPESERGRVVERFYRLDPARSSEGTGLGLALVAAVAKLHGAGFVLGDNAPGLRAVLDFPRDR